LRLYILIKYATVRYSIHPSIHIIRQILQIVLPGFGKWSCYWMTVRSPVSNVFFSADESADKVTCNYTCL